jgi:hypothetical protein
MLVTYEFNFESGKKQSFPVETERHATGIDSSEGCAPEKWTVLDYCQCSNCPLKKDRVKYCPAALDLQGVVEAFKKEAAFQKVEVRVVTPPRTYTKKTSLEEGLRSMMGLIMATSGCPVLGELKPMALHHIPFSSNDEFVLRSVSLYLMQQYFNQREHQPVDWELKGLVERNKRLQIVNQALWQRVHAVCEGDSSLKALLSFFSLASSITFSLEAQLLKIKKSIASGRDSDDVIKPF